MANELVIRNGLVSKGDVTLPISVENGNYIVKDDDYSLVLSGTSDLTVTLPTSATTLTGKVYVFKNFSSSNNLTIATADDTLIELSTDDYVLLPLQSAVLQSDGTQWIKTGQSGTSGLRGGARYTFFGSTVTAGQAGNLNYNTGSNTITLSEDDADGIDLSGWIDSWDDLGKGTVTIQNADSSSIVIADVNTVEIIVGSQPLSRSVSLNTPLVEDWSIGLVQGGDITVNFTKNGTSGSSGSSGTSGSSGSSGSSGTSGSSGSSGTSGSSGSSGTSGSSGSSGTSGSSGSSGTSGSSGSSGTSGSSGSSGSSGTSGSSGSSGTSGSSGSSGTSGSSGSSGTSGSSGSSGTSGKTIIPSSCIDGYTATNGATPSSNGEVKLSLSNGSPTSSFSSVGRIELSAANEDGVLYGVWIAAIESGDTLRVENFTDGGGNNFIIGTVSSVTTSSGNYVIILTSNGGNANSGTFSTGDEIVICNSVAGTSGSSGSSGTSGSSGSSGTSGSSGSSGTSGISLCLSQKANTTTGGILSGKFTVSTTTGTGGVTSNPNVAPYYIYLDDNGYIGETLISDYILNYVNGFSNAAGLITFTDAEDSGNYVSYYFGSWFIPTNSAYIRLSCNSYSGSNPHNITSGFTDFVNNKRYCITIQTYPF